MTLSPRQQNVLVAVDLLDGLRSGEGEIWSVGLKRELWPARTVLYGTLKTLMVHRYLERKGERGGFQYVLTDKGRRQLA